MSFVEIGTDHVKVALMEYSHRNNEGNNFFGENDLFNQLSCRLSSDGSNRIELDNRELSFVADWCATHITRVAAEYEGKQQ